MWPRNKNNQKVNNAVILNLILKLKIDVLPYF